MNCHLTLLQKIEDQFRQQNMHPTASTYVTIYQGITSSTKSACIDAWAEQT